MILEYEDYRFLGAASGQEGIALCQRERPDLVLLDIKMPGMDGMEVLRKLHAARRDAAGGHDLGPRHHGRRPSTRSSPAPPTSSRSRSAASASSSRCATSLTQSELRSENRELKLAMESKYEIVGQSPALRTGARLGAARRADQRHGAAARRERRRQGAGGAHHPPQQPARRPALHPGELRRDSRGADRVGAVRPREGVVHRRHREAGRQVRAGRPRHDLPGRSRRHEPEDAGQGAARAAGAGGGAARARRARSRWTCA